MGVRQRRKIERERRERDTREAALWSEGRALERPAACSAIRETDEEFCPACGLRWDAADERPSCPKKISPGRRQG